MNEQAGRSGLVILDRDGVINQDSEAYIRTADDWIPIPGSLEAIARLYHAGFRILVATNQSGLGRGYMTIDDLNDMHRKMRDQLNGLGAQIEAVFFCPHGPEVGCRCRKPRPGLLEEIVLRLQVDIRGTPVVGDSLRDIQAAWAVGATPILVLTGKGRSTLEHNPEELTDVAIFADLAAFVDALLGGSSPR